MSGEGNRAVEERPASAAGRCRQDPLRRNAYGAELASAPGKLRFHIRASPLDACILSDLTPDRASRGTRTSGITWGSR